MRLFFELVLSAAIAVGSSQLLSAQDLAPRAYVITPLHANVITLTWAYYDGNINYNGALPISGATGTYSVPIFSYYHSFGFFGRSANIVASLPYGAGNFRGTAFGAEQHLGRVRFGRNRRQPAPRGLTPPEHFAQPSHDPSSPAVLRR